MNKLMNQLFWIAMISGFAAEAMYILLQMNVLH